MEIKIVAETPDYLVIEKPAGVLVHATQAKEEGTVVDWLLKRYPKIKKVGDPSTSSGQVQRPGIVHRLDKEASGLLVIAKTQAMFEHLKKQFQERETEKEYLVLVYGKVLKDEGIIDFDIDRGREGRMVSRPKVDKLDLDKVKDIQEGREALTEFWVEKRFARFTMLCVRIHTGRTHQIRVHMFAYNHPVVGDELYLNKKLIKKNEQKLGRLFLHAAKLCFMDLQGEKRCFKSELPGELKNYLHKLN